MDWTPPPSGDGTNGGGAVSGAWAGVQSMPRWQIITIVLVIVGGVYYYYVHRAAATAQATDPANTWENSARSLLLSRGYPSSEVDSALNHYLHGGAMSPGDITLISVAIRALGTPDVPSTAPANTPANPWNAPGPSAPTANNVSSSAPSNNIQAQTYWYVQSVGVGWTSTFNGIATQFYGDQSLATQVMSQNPGVTSSVYAKIPVGIRIKVPRTVAT